MSKVLGIDLGTNSLGWALVNTETSEIIKTGVRIFPEGVNRVKGKETPKNAERRIARGIRKNNFRYKLRRNRLLSLLEELSMLPGKEYFTSEKNKNYSDDQKKIKRNFTYELYQLRKKALEEKLSMEQIGRIFLHLNNHRGFKSNAKEKAELEYGSDDKRKEEHGKVAKSSSELRKKIQDAKANNYIKYGTLGEYFFYLIQANFKSHNINEPIHKIRNNDEGEGHYTLREMFEEEFDLIWEKQEGYYADDERGRSIFTEENKKKIKDECIFYQRDLRSVKHLISKCPFEFTTYKKQKQEKVSIEKSYQRCCSKSSFLFQEYRIWETLSNLRYKIGDDWIALSLEQKQMLSQHLEYADVMYLNKPDRRFRNLTKEEKLQIEKDINRLLSELKLPNDAEFNITKINGNRTVSKIVEGIGKEFWLSLNKVPLESKYGLVDETTGELIIANSYSKEQESIWHAIYFSSHFSNSQEWLLRKKGFKNNKLTRTYEKLGFNEDQINRLSSIVFEPGYAPYSAKALKKLIPHLKAGFDKHGAVIRVYGKSDGDIRMNDDNLLDDVPLVSNNNLKNPIVQQGANEAIRLINAIIEDEQIGKPDEVRIEFTRELKKPKEVRETQKRRNDEKEAERMKYASFLSKKLQQYISKDDDRILKFELFLELDWSKESFEEIKDGIDIKDFIEFIKNIDDDKVRDYQKKYELWLECDRRLPYTGKVIRLSQLFTSEIEIEHIVPYSRCFDDSYANKTLSCKSFNTKKGNLTPMEYFERRTSIEREEFEARIKDFSDSKRKRFLMKTEDIDDFRNNQLNNTAYSTTLLSEQLRKAFKSDQVKITNGAITSILRGLFGLNTLLNQPIKVPGYENGRYWVVFDEDDKFYTLFTKIDDTQPKIQTGHTLLTGYVNNELLRIGKTRNDHRHHTIDAIAIAFTNQRIVQFIGTITQGRLVKNGKEVKVFEEGTEYVKAFDEYGHFTKEVRESIKEEIQSYYDIKAIRSEARDKVDKILVSYRSNIKLTSSGRKRVYTSSGKILKVKDKQGGEKVFFSGGDVARGQLHEATLYGKICYNQLKDDDKIEWMKRDGIYVYRVPLKFSPNKGSFFSSPEQLKKIVDPVIRSLAEKAAAEKGIKQALLDGIYLPNNPKKNDPPGLLRKPIKVKHVRIANDSKELAGIRSYKEQKKDYKKAYVETGENYMIAIYGDFEGNHREYMNITLLEAARIEAKNTKRKKAGLLSQPVYPPTKNGLVFLMTLSKGDLVLVYNNHPDEVDIKNDNAEVLFKRLFRVIKSDKNGIIVLGRHNLANIKADKDKPVKDISSNEGSVIRKNYKTIKCVKVVVDRLGRIVMSSNISLFDEPGKPFVALSKESEKEKKQPTVN